jgi:hypothetical protein
MDLVISPFARFTSDTPYHYIWLASIVDFKFEFCCYEPWPSGLQLPNFFWIRLYSAMGVVQRFSRVSVTTNSASILHHDDHTGVSLGCVIIHGVQNIRRSGQKGKEIGLEEDSRLFSFWVRKSQQKANDGAPEAETLFTTYPLTTPVCLLIVGIQIDDTACHEVMKSVVLRSRHCSSYV